MNGIRLAAILAITVLVLPLAAMCQAQSDLSSVLKLGGSSYFTAKMENLTTRLQLSPEQKVKIKPIVEQEVGLFEQIHNNVAVSPKEKLKKFKNIISDSDRRMKPILSASQWQKLQALRKDQRPELEEIAKAVVTASKK